MKRNFFKTVLPAFAFMMAIVASFAFSPALNGVDQIQSYIQKPNDCKKSIIAPIDCLTTNIGLDCTITKFGTTYSLYATQSSPTLCTSILKKPL